MTHIFFSTNFLKGINRSNKFIDFFREDSLRVISLILLIISLLVSDGLFSIDELIYFAGAKALVADASFIINNGYEQFGSEQLALWLLIEGPNGLAPQYPAGSALVAAPLVAILGVRGFILMNVLAAIASLYMVRALAIRLFNDSKTASLTIWLLLGATYFLDYAFVVWPHMVSLLCVSGAVLWFLRAMQEPSSAGRWAFYAGLWISAGFLFRLDTILLIPAFALVWISIPGTPFWTVFGGAMGLLPGLIISAIIAFLKFGTINPLSYGRPGANGEGVEISGHASVVVLMLILFVLALVIRYRSASGRQNWYSYPALVGAVLFALYGIVDSDFLRQTLVGIYALLIDMTTVSDSRSGVVYLENGLVSFWGLPKKSLGQSLPWLGLLATIFTLRWKPQERPTKALIAFVTIVWMLPFITRSWHGGMSSNMRYFLPLLPLLCVISSRLWFSVLEGSKITGKVQFSLICLGIMLPSIWISFMPAGVPGAHQTLSVWVLSSVAIASFIVVIFPYAKENFLPVARCIILLAIGMAMFLSFGDLANSQKRRILTKQIDVAVKTLEGPLLIFISPETVPSVLYQKPARLVASRESKTGEIDLNLARQALESGHRVYVDKRFKPNSQDLTDSDLELREIEQTFGKLRLVEISVRRNRADSLN